MTNTARFSDLTDAIKEDWGGKPFVDLRKGWKYILDNYPQVWDPVFFSSITRSPRPYRSIRTAPSLLVLVTGDTPSSRFSTFRVLVTVVKDVSSWIQSNPEFGFGFKALVCHDGVRGGTDT